MTATTAPPPAADTGGLESAAGTPVREGRFPTLDGYRAIAAFAVVLVHVGFTTARSVTGTGYSFLSRGDIGVPVFFVLSGFLLYRPMVQARLSGRPQPQVRPYLIKRILRIVPAYWISVVFAMLALNVNDFSRHSPAEWLRFLGFAQVYSTSLRTQGLEQNWSLCVEMSFYLLLPLWPLLIGWIDGRLDRWRPGRRRGIRIDLAGAAGLVLVGVLWQIMSHVPHMWLPWTAGNWLPEYAGWFAGGMVLATLREAQRFRPEIAVRYDWIYRLAEAPGTCLMVAGALYLICLTPLGGPYDLARMTGTQVVVKQVLYGAFAFCFLFPGCLGDQTVGRWRRALSLRPMQKLGAVSYGVFLFHMPVLYLIAQVAHLKQFSGHFGWVLIATVGFTLVISFASLWLVERPALRLARRLAAKSTRRSWQADAMPAPAEG